LIAVVDNEASVRKAVGRLIRAAGYEVAAYESGTEFLDSLAQHQPACVVLDLHMPQLSGFDVQAELNRRAHRIPVVILTADYTPDTIARATQLGAVACLPKPVDGTHLIAAIRDALTGAQR
jgi:FixJ family two-component response regulator